MQSKKTLLFLILMLLVLFGALAFFFGSDLQRLAGLQPAIVPIKNTLGENITFNVGGRTVSIPSKFPQKTLDYLKEEMIEPAGLPLRLEREGNPLPFGIP